jgi:hypothetical protein
VWTLLRERGALSPRCVAQALNMTKLAACAALRRLAAKGCARGSGTTHARRYRARPRSPADLRGKSDGTMANLARGRVLGLHAIAAKRGRPFRPRPQHALDKAWGARP